MDCGHPECYKFKLKRAASEVFKLRQALFDLVGVLKCKLQKDAAAKRGCSNYAQVAVGDQNSNSNGTDIREATVRSKPAQEIQSNIHRPAKDLQYGRHGERFIT